MYYMCARYKHEVTCNLIHQSELKIEICLKLTYSFVLLYKDLNCINEIGMICYYWPYFIHISLNLLKYYYLHKHAYICPGKEMCVENTIL